jgi:phage tail tube protein FII
MNKSRFPTKKNMRQAFQDNYGNDSNTKVVVKKERVTITWQLHGDFKRGEGSSMDKAIASFYNTEVPMNEG